MRGLKEHGPGRTMVMLTFVKTASVTEDSSNLRVLAVSGRFKTYFLVGASNYLRTTTGKEKKLKNQRHLRVYYIDMVRAGHLGGEKKQMFKQCGFNLRHKRREKHLCFSYKTKA